jgi:YD repeat-containing protein
MFLPADASAGSNCALFYANYPTFPGYPSAREYECTEVQLSKWGYLSDPQHLDEPGRFASLADAAADAQKHCTDFNGGTPCDENPPVESYFLTGQLASISIGFTGDASFAALAGRSERCPVGWSREDFYPGGPGSPPSNTTVKFTVCLKLRAEICPIIGNPTSLGSGTKLHNEPIISDGSLRLSLNYVSQTVASDGNLRALPAHGFGDRWIHNFHRKIQIEVLPDGSRVAVVQGASTFGESERFTATSQTAAWTQITAIVHGYSLTTLFSGSGQISGYKLQQPDNSIEEFDADGFLISITYLGNSKLLFSYEAGAGGRRLRTVTDNFGRSILFEYVTVSVPETYPTLQYLWLDLVSKIVATDGAIYEFSYAPQGRADTDAAEGETIIQRGDRLESIRFPGGAEKRFSYEIFSGLLSSIVDENGAQFAKYSYNPSGVVVSTSNAGGALEYSFETGSKVTSPLGAVESYGFQRVAGVRRQTSHRRFFSDEPDIDLQERYSRREHDLNGNVISETDFDGNQTTRIFDLVRNLETSRTEGVGSPVARTITTQWDTFLRLPTKITEPVSGGSRVTDLTYDANGNLIQRIITAPKNDGTGASEARAWNWSFNASGQMLTAKNPRNQTTTYVYASESDTAVPPKYAKGDLLTMTNAAGHVTTYNEYDRAGRLLNMIDANGLMTTMTYHPRGWIKSRSLANGVSVETTSYAYDSTGQLTRVTLPDGSSLFYAYDAAHRMIGISEQSNAIALANGDLRVAANNLQGDRVIYTLDKMGNRIKEEHFDATGSVQKLRSRVFDELNRLQKDIGGSNPAAQITRFTYDGRGNQLTTSDPLARLTTNRYDPFNRLIAVVDPQNGEAGATAFTYDPANNLTSVKDPSGLVTTYVYSGHNQLVKQVSPDTGTSFLGYDAAGNLTTKLDSAGRCAINSYDALNRITTTKFFASNLSTNSVATCVANTPVVSSETINYTFDDPAVANSKGRMTKFMDGTGTTAYTYDKNGRVLTKVQTTNDSTNPTQTVAYKYNAFGQLASTITPSGQNISYSYTQNRISGIKVNGVDIVKGAVYEPFGPNGGWSWGNHTGSAVNQHLRVFDLDYRPVIIKSDPEGYSRNIQWDTASRILNQTDAASVNPNPALSRSFVYDRLDRLTSFVPGAGSTLIPQEFSYDSIGNRVSLMLAPGGTASTPGNTQTYNYSGTSHQLQNITGNVEKYFTYDATGNTIVETGANNLTFEFDHKNRMRRVRVGTNTADTVTYYINALGQRVRKLGAGVHATNAAASSKSVRFIYDEQGRLLGEYDDLGRLIQETVWFNDLPVTTVRPKGSYATNPIGLVGGL